MESKIKQFVNENKGFVVFYLIWFLLHLIFISVGIEGGGKHGLWPFAESRWAYTEYDLKDLLFYLVTPIVILVIWKLIGKDLKKSN